jgi:UDP-N-acetylglucosamine--N-acetylmuramyl-(pentapeptide) pyrophosphoryl-undecaprenol N-acetylglucosamine transferase
MFPAQALAEAMLRRGWRVTLSTDARGARYAGGFPDQVDVRQVASATFARGGALARRWCRFACRRRRLAATLRMYRERPAWWWASAAIPAIPALAAAWLTRRPRA